MTTSPTGGFSVSPNPARYRIVGMKAQRRALPPSAAVALGEGLLYGLPSGALLAIPIAIRLEAPLAHRLLVWLAALGLHGALLGLVVGSLRVARPLPSRTPALIAALGMAMGPLTVVAATLHRVTHHRPLGAATFGVVALGLMLGCLAISVRAITSLRSSRPSRRLHGWVLLALGLAASALLTLPYFWMYLRVASLSPLFGGLLLDGLLGLALGVVGGFARFPRKLESTSRSAGPMALAVCLLTLAVALRSPVTSPALESVSALWAYLF